MGHYDSCRSEPTTEELLARLSEAEERLQMQRSAVLSNALTMERVLAQLAKMQPVVDEAVRVVDRMGLPPPALLDAVRRYQGKRT